MGVVINPHLGRAAPCGGHVGLQGEGAASDAVAQVVEVEAVVLLGFRIGEGFDLRVASGQVIENHFFGHGTPNFVPAFCAYGFKSFSQL